MEKIYCIYCGSDCVDKISGSNTYDCIDCDQTFKKEEIIQKREEMETVAIEVQNCVSKGEKSKTPYHAVGNLVLQFTNNEDIINGLHAGFPYLVDALTPEIVKV